MKSDNEFQHIPSIQQHYAEVALSAADNCSAARGCAYPLEKAALKPGEVVLDAGCGGGAEALEAAQLVGTNGFVYGIDMTPEMIMLAQKAAADTSCNNISFLQGFMEELPLKDSSVNVVISNCVINLSNNRKRVIQELRRVLKPEGRLVLADIVLLSTSLAAETEHHVAPLLGCVNGVLKLVEYETILRDSGFQDITLDIYQRFDLSRLKSRAKKRQAVEALRLLEDPILAKQIHGAFASVYILATARDK